MSIQIFKNAIPNELFLNLLDHIATKNEKHYYFDCSCSDYSCIMDSSIYMACGDHDDTCIYWNCHSVVYYCHIYDRSITYSNPWYPGSS